MVGEYFSQNIVSDSAYVGRELKGGVLSITRMVQLLAK